MVKIKILLIILCILAVSGCTSSTQIFSGTGTGSVYGRIQAIEHFTEVCDNYLVYFEKDVGTGDTKQTAGAYCIKNNDPDIMVKLKEFARRGVRVEAKYETAFAHVCGCDYNAWIYSVEELP